MKLINGGKTVQRLPKFEFPEDFSLSAFLKHYCNIVESIILKNQMRHINPSTLKKTSVFKALRFALITKVSE